MTNLKDPKDFVSHKLVLNPEPEKVKTEEDKLKEEENKLIQKYVKSTMRH